MHPTLFEIFGHKIPSYGVLLIIGFAAGLWLCFRRAAAYGFTKGEVADAGFWALILGILGARIFYIAQQWQHYGQNPGDIFQWRFQGLTSFGGIVFGVLAVALYAKRNKKSPIKLIDLMIVGFVLAHIIGRLGCLLNGCCYGHQTTLPWGITMPNLPGVYHPAQVYDSLLNIAVLAGLLWFEKRRPATGQVLALFLILHGLARFIYEFWRMGVTAEPLLGLPISEAQGMTLGMMALGGILFVWFGRRTASREAVAA
jgi:phosphatidylglycerol---prolipoprotein diacylglyceryl transferase